MDQSSSELHAKCSTIYPSSLMFEFSVNESTDNVGICLPEGMQGSPDYARRSGERNRVAPITLFAEKTDRKVEFCLEEKDEEAVFGIVNDGAVEASIELGRIPEVNYGLISINVGCVDGAAAFAGVDFQNDAFYAGGDIIKARVPIGCGEEQALYQFAREGNFLYNFRHIEAGNYLIDLHFADIVFTEGPPGMRVFDVFIQDEKVVSSLDVYARVGANKPLVLSDFRASVVGMEGLSIRFEGIIGSPILSAISIRSDCLTGNISQSQSQMDLAPVSAGEQDDCSLCGKVLRDNQLLLKEQAEFRKTLEDLKRENESKSRECLAALKSLQELKMELMRKSMYVGSLAFAVEGQVKEKSQWFQSLAGLSKKLQLLKSEHAKLSDDALQLKTWQEDVGRMAIAIKSTMDSHITLQREYEDLKERFNEEAKDRKDLYNKVIELKGNIRVFCRCRPLNTEEITGGASMIVDFESAKDGELVVKGHVSSKKIFKFDSVFSPEVDQEAVFDKTAPFATSVLDGYNVCIFAYGQTGTGKTFTMEGTEAARGVNYRTLEELFRIIREREGLFRYDVTVSVLEVYNEQIRDLLLPAAQPGVTAKRLEIRQVADGVHHVPGLVEAPVRNTNEVWEVLKTGSKARAVGSTNANEHSSRSHCIHCVMVKGENLVNGECTRSKLWLIDLAGSERVAKTDAQGDRLKEAQNINKSLSSLGDVISALATKSSHVPFRNSKLTHLLQDSLGGDSKTLMFVQISPHENDISETLCSLNFASRVRGIELGPARRQVDVSEIARFKQMVGKVKEENKHKDFQLKKMEETIHSLEMKSKAKDLINKNLQDKIKELESQLLIERKLARQHVDTRIAEHHLHQQQVQQQQREEERISLKGDIEPLTEFMQGDIESHGGQHLIPFKELENVVEPLSMLQTPIKNNVFKQFPPVEDKENKPGFLEEPLARKASRASLCPITSQMPVSSARRNSLLPLPVAKVTGGFSPMPTNREIFSPLPQRISDNVGAGEIRSQPRSNNSKKINSILRRSLQKKVIIRPQLPPTVKKGSALAGFEKLRVSIGGSGRQGRRTLLRNAPDPLMPRQQQKQKERGWNLGTTPTRNFY